MNFYFVGVLGLISLAVGMAAELDSSTRGRFSQQREDAVCRTDNTGAAHGLVISNGYLLAMPWNSGQFDGVKIGGNCGGTTYHRVKSRCGGIGGTITVDVVTRALGADSSFGSRGFCRIFDRVFGSFGLLVRGDRFDFEQLRCLIIATWKNKVCMIRSLLWSTLVLCFALISGTGLLEMDFGLKTLVLFLRMSWRIGWLSIYSLPHYCAYYLGQCCKLVCTVCDCIFRCILQVCNFNNYGVVVFLVVYYHVLLLLLGVDSAMLLCLLFCSWLWLSCLFYSFDFVDFDYENNRFLDSKETLFQRVKLAMTVGNGEGIDMLLPYDVFRSFRRGFVYWHIRTRWHNDEVDIATKTIRIPFVGKFKGRALEQELLRLDAEFKPNIVKIARSWSYSRFCGFYKQALCDNPDRFYVGQGIFSAILRKRGDHMDQLEDIVSLVASLVLAAYQPGAMHRTAQITLALNNFRRSILGTKLCNKFAAAGLDFDTVFQHSVLGEQLSEFVTYATECRDQISRTAKKFGGSSVEACTGLAAAGFSVFTRLTASEPMSAYRQKMIARRNAKGTYTSDEIRKMDENAARLKREERSALASPPVDWKSETTPWEAQAGEGLGMAFDTVRNFISSGREAAQSVTSGKVIKVVASLLALSAFIRSGNFEIRAFEDVVTEIRNHDFMKCATLFDGICESCNWILSTGQTIYSGGNPFLIPSSIKTWEKEASELLLHQRFVGNDQFEDPAGNKIDPMALRIRLVDCISQYSKLTVQLSMLTGSKDTLRLYKSLYDQLRVFLTELRTRADTGSTRIPPLGILLHGAPGIGKTTLMNAIFCWLSNRDGLQFDKNSVFRRPPGSRFWSGFNSEKLWLIIDDVATFRPTSKMTDESLTDIIHVLNSSPFNPDMNLNEEKGKFVCNIRAVCATTNTLTMDVPINFNSPNAIYRRFHYYLSVRLKPGRFNVGGKLRAQNLSENDYIALGPNSSFLFPDFWEFDLMDLQGGAPRVVRTFHSFYDLMNEMGTTYADHRLSEGKIKDREMEYQRVEFCPATHAPREICPCPLCPKHAAHLTRMAARVQGFGRRIIARQRMVLQATLLATQVQSGHTFDGSIYSPIGYMPILLGLIGLYCAGRLIRALIVQLIADSVDQINRDLNETLQASADRAVADNYPDICARSEAILNQHLLATRQWFEVNCRTILNTWTPGAILRSSVNGIYMLLTRSIGYMIIGYRRVRRGLTLLYVSRAIRRHITYRNMILVALAAAIAGVLLATRQCGILPAKPVFETQMGKPHPVPGPGGSEPPRNVWVVNSELADTFGTNTSCSRGASQPKALESILKDTIIFEVEYATGELDAFHGYPICGHSILVNDHCIDKLWREGGSFQLMFPYTGNRIRKTIFDRNAVIRNTSKDLALIYVNTLNSRTSKIEYFIEENHDWSLFSQYKFALASTEVSGATELDNLHPADSWMHPGNTSLEAKVGIPTEGGDCGRLVIGCGPHGICILGLHQARWKQDPNLVQAAFVGRTWLLKAHRALQTKCSSVVGFDTQIGHISAETISFAGVEQSDGPILDKNDKPVVFESMSRQCALHERFKNLDQDYAISGYGVFWLGKLPNVGRKSMTSSVRSTPFREFFEARGFSCMKVAPTFDWKSKVLHLRNIGRTSNELDPGILNDCVQTYIRQILTTLPESERSLFEVYDLDTAINGVPGVAYVDKMKLSTSAGYPHYCAKRNLVYTDYDGVNTTYTLHEEYEERTMRYYTEMCAGRRPRFLFSGNQKDEGISMDKNRTRGPRLFMAGSIYSILIGRMLFLSYIRVVQRNPFIFFSAVGMNCFSRIWAKLYVYITVFGLDSILAGDYKNFDQKMSPRVLEAAYSVIIGVMTSKLNGYSRFSEEERTAAIVWANTCVYPDCEVDGDCYQLCGSNPSGNSMTVHTNCTVNVLYIMYAWKVTGHKVELFFKCVVMMTYGDDNIVAVMGEFKVTFNYSTIHAALLTIGVEYTPADKSEPSSKHFDKIEELQFLKRGFALRGDRMYCPIDVATIHKLGCIWMKSTLSEREHTMAILKDIWREGHIQGGLIQEQCQNSVKEYLNTVLRIELPCAGFLSDAEFEASYDDNSEQYEKFCKYRESSLISEKDSQNYVQQLLSMSEYPASVRGLCVDPPEAVPRRANLVQGGVLQDRTQQGVWSSPCLVKLTAENNLISFDDEAPAQVATLEVAAKKMEEVPNVVSEWLGRPVRILNQEWDEEDTFDVISFPLQEYMKVARVWEKIKGFGRLRCTLNLKFVLNASPFHYGAVLVSWCPMGNPSQSVPKPLTNFSGAHTLLDQTDAIGLNMIESVRPHIMLFPQDNSSGELHIPYLYPKPWFDLESSAATSDDLAFFGTLRMRTLTALKMAQTATACRCTISVYAWLSDVQLSAPSFVAQSAMLGEVSAATKSLSAMPVLGGAFEYTSKLTKASANLMKLLGMSNPSNIDTVDAVAPVALPHLASTEISVPVASLAVAPKSGLSYAGNTGVEDDELLIDSICKRDALIGVYPWTNDYDVGRSIFKAYVTPEIYRQAITSNGCTVLAESVQQVYQTPACYVAQMFTHWRGTMVYTVRLVASNFHRGRLRVYYDACQPVPTSPPEAGVYSEVIDITTEKELEIRVPWCAATPYLRVPGSPFAWTDETRVKPPITSPDDFTFGYYAYDDKYHNGAIDIHVANTLMGPVASTVYLLVTMRMEDAQFAGPCQIGSQDSAAGAQISPYSPFLAQSKFLAAPLTTEKVSGSDYFGEEIVSLRELLHRSCQIPDLAYDGKITGTSVPQKTESVIYYARRPPFPGQPNYLMTVGGSRSVLNNSSTRLSLHQSSVGASRIPFTFSKMTPYNYLRLAFLGERGSHVYKFVYPPNGRLQASQFTRSLNVIRFPRIIPFMQTTWDTLFSSGGSSAAKSQLARPGTTEGCQIGTVNFDNGVQVSLPMYSRFSFLPTSALGWGLALDTLGDDGACEISEDNFAVVTQQEVQSSSNTYEHSTLSVFHSVGVDFNLIAFLNPPVLHFTKSWPTAA